MFEGFVKICTSVLGNWPTVGGVESVSIMAVIGDGTRSQGGKGGGGRKSGLIILR